MFILKFKTDQGRGEKTALLCDSFSIRPIRRWLPNCLFIPFGFNANKKEHKQGTQFLTQCAGGGQGVSLMYPKVWLRQITSSSLPYYTPALFRHIGSIRGPAPAIWWQKRQRALMPLRNRPNYLPGERSDLQLSALPAHSRSTNRPPKRSERRLHRTCSWDELHFASRDSSWFLGHQYRWLESQARFTLKVRLAVDSQEKKGSLNQGRPAASCQVAAGALLLAWFCHLERTEVLRVAAQKGHFPPTSQRLAEAHQLTWKRTVSPSPERTPAICSKC